METKYTFNPNVRENDQDARFRLSQKLVLFNEADGKFLLVIEPMGDEELQERKYEPWNFPGGHLMSEENPLEGLTREIQEELGKEVKYGDCEVVDFLLQKSGYVVYLTSYLGGEIHLSDEHEKYIWKTAEEIEKDEKFHPLLRQAIQSSVKRLKEREYLNDAKRIYADFENYKRRQEERMKELSAMCVEGVALDMIPVLDNFRAAGAHVPEEERAKAWMTGITYIGKQLEDALASHGLVAYEAKEGEMFDPYLHEAVSHEKGDGEQEGKIVKSLQPGYKIGSKVIRPAKVIVA